MWNPFSKGPSSSTVAQPTAMEGGIETGGMGGGAAVVKPASTLDSAIPTPGADAMTPTAKTTAGGPPPIAPVVGAEMGPNPAVMGAPSSEGGSDSASGPAAMVAKREEEQNAAGTNFGQKAESETPGAEGQPSLDVTASVEPAAEPVADGQAVTAVETTPPAVDATEKPEDETEHVDTTAVDVTADPMAAPVAPATPPSPVSLATGVGTPGAVDGQNSPAVDATDPMAPASLDAAPTNPLAVATEQTAAPAESVTPAAEPVADATTSSVEATDPMAPTPEPITDPVAAPNPDATTTLAGDATPDANVSAMPGVTPEPQSQEQVAAAQTGGGPIGMETPTPLSTGDASGSTAMGEQPPVSAMETSAPAVTNPEPLEVNPGGSTGGTTPTSQAA